MGFAESLQRMDARVQSRLGDSCVYAPTSGPEVTLPCIYDASYVVSEPRSPGVSSEAPAVFVRAAALPAGWEADVDATVRRAAVAYSIREVKPDGQGGVTLLLHVRA